MAKKKNTTKKTTKKSVAKSRKPNRYNEVRRVVSKYCKEKYNHRCSNDEMNKIYRAIKRRDETSNRPQTIRDIVNNIEAVLQFKDKNELPSMLFAFQWWSFMEDIGTKDGLFFKDSDELSFDLSSLGLGIYKSKHKDLAKIYYSDIYPKMREVIKEAEIEKGMNINSPVPQFEFDEGKSDQPNRKFFWKLELGDANNQSIIDDMIGRKSPKTSMKKAKAPTQSDMVKRNEQRNKALEMLQADFDKGIYSVDEYKKEREIIMNKYQQGGVIDNE
jgi:hypothetical protein